jgi:hypothetical protein
MPAFVKGIKKLGGMTLILIGVILLIVSHLTILSNFNFVLLIGLFLVVFGIILHVWLIKREEKY